MLYIDQFVYTNKMRTSHPAERFAFAFLTMIISLVVNSPKVHLAVIVIMLAFLLLKAGIPGRVVLKLMLVPVGFLLIGVFTIAVSISPAAGTLFNLKVGSFYVVITPVSLALAGSTLLKSLSATTSLYFLILTTPMTELLYVLQLMRLPAIIIELMMLIYRFIFVFLETAFYIYTAQSARLGFINFKTAINSFGLLFANLWGKAFLKSQALFASLLSRGYTGDLKVLNPRHTLSPVNILFFCLIDLGLIALAML